MTGSIETSRLLEAFRRFVPGCYVRDYRDNGGWICVAKDYKTLWSAHDNTEHKYKNMPAVTLANFPPGYTTPQTLVNGAAMTRPGWRLQMRQARRFISEAQARAMERFLGRKVFT